MLTRTERLRVQYPVELRLPAGYGSIAEVSVLTLLDSRWQKDDVIMHLEIHVIARAYLIMLIRNHGGTRVVLSASEKGGYERPSVSELPRELALSQRTQLDNTLAVLLLC